jgi:PAS domain S-box-containing protein
MAAKPKSKKKAGSARRSVDAGDKDKLIIEQKNRIAVLEKELRLKQNDAMSEDIAECKRDVLALRESEARSKVAEAVEVERRRLFNVLETLPAMICLLTPDYHVAFANRSFRERFGESHGRHCYEYCFGRAEPCEFCEAYVPLKTGQPHRWEVTGPDGSVIEAYDFPFTDSDGSPRILEMDIDITEHTRAEEKLRENHRFTTYLMGNLPGMVYRRRNVKDWTMEFLSSGCLKLTGYKIEDLFLDRTIPYGQLIHPDDRKRVWDEMQVAIHANKPYTLNYRIITAGQEEKWVLDQGRDIIKNNKVLLEGFITDITERKQADDALNVAKQQAELYVDLMSHDINNMNQLALGYLELALQKLESDKNLKMEDRMLIENPMQTLTNSSALIKNVRKLQILSTEGIKITSLDINMIFQELEEMSFHSQDREIIINIPHVPGYMIEANELLKDVFVNLITNAVKHSDAAKPLTINVNVVPVIENGRRYIKCMVEDNGPGIPDWLKNKLFNRFQRGSSKAHGRGLGLYLVKTLVEGYRGKVWVEDRVPGDHTKGARFVVMLPAVEN